MTTTTLPTSRPVTQDWNQDFEWLNGVHYPNGFYDSIGWYGHNGIDYGCWEGDPAEAVCDGVIEFAGDGNNHRLLTGGGNAVLLRNEELGVMFEYLHLSRIDVRQGQSVKRGQVIARTGNTGTSTAPHLHIGAIPIYNVNVNNGYRGRVDPTPFLYGPLNPDYALTPQSSSKPKPAKLTDPLEEIMSYYTDRADFEAWQRRIVREEIAKAALPKEVWDYGTTAADGKTKTPMHRALRDPLNGLVAAVAAEKGLSAEQLQKIIEDAIAKTVVTVDVSVSGKDAA